MNTAHSAPSSSLTMILLRLVLLAAIDVLGIWLIFGFIESNAYFLVGAFALVLILVNFVILNNDAYPLRWMLIGLVLMVLIAIYPIIFTVWVAFTNFGDGHLLTREKAIEQILTQRYLPEGAGAYSWTLFQSDDGEFALWLQNETTPGLLAYPGEPVIAADPGTNGVGEFDEDGIPLTLEGYERVPRGRTLGLINELGEITFGAGDTAVQITTLDLASALEPLYVYDEARNVMINQRTGVEYQAIDGTFTAPNGDEIRPGYQAVIGAENFTRFVESPALRGPLVRIMTWNFAFAFLSVFTTFALGLAVALLYNDPEFPGKKVIQTVLLVPYTIPSLITILIWRGLMNPEIGIINRTLENLIGWAPPWFTDQWWAKAAILIVNLWLGYPYFMIICSGALQAIPKDIYAAAEVDGASIWQRFRQITLPLLLVSVGPLLIASFTFNFNNFNLIFLFIQGGPPIAGAATRAGHTDILISYVYNLAFAGGRGFDYGLASAVTIIIFIIVATITLLQFRYTQMWEEVSENV